MKSSTRFKRSLWPTCSLKGTSFPNLATFTSPATFASSSRMLCASPPAVPPATYKFKVSSSGDAAGDGPEPSTKFRTLNPQTMNLGTKETVMMLALIRVVF